MAYPQDQAISLRNETGLYFSLNGPTLELSAAPYEFKRQPTIIKGAPGEPATFVFFEPEQFDILKTIFAKSGILAQCFYHCDNTIHQLDFLTITIRLANDTIVVKEVQPQQ